MTEQKTTINSMVLDDDDDDVFVISDSRTGTAFGVPADDIVFMAATILSRSGEHPKNPRGHFVHACVVNGSLLQYDDASHTTAQETETDSLTMFSPTRYGFDEVVARLASRGRFPTKLEPGKFAQVQDGWAVLATVHSDELSTMYGRYRVHAAFRLDGIDRFEVKGTTVTFYTTKHPDPGEQWAKPIDLGDALGDKEHEVAAFVELCRQHMSA